MGNKLLLLSTFLALFELVPAEMTAAQSTDNSVQRHDTADAPCRQAAWGHATHMKHMDGWQRAIFSTLILVSRSDMSSRLCLIKCVEWENFHTSRDPRPAR